MISLVMFFDDDILALKKKVQSNTPSNQKNQSDATEIHCPLSQQTSLTTKYKPQPSQTESEKQSKIQIPAQI
jgi:hypothetical protein